ncbi:phosphate ABC transporter substrate-binding protein PstS [Falsarthrobacter nasiphocae]|uniref:Phosphate-binding protein n=1 Tax=Falsarthrobacter nasiphocae TaxID=189863 RepID=A0AAE3YGU5_9MICC|nr:phosphate ABC transporter substrate-binding protein PstS [Falsarthrobacter nasiphocae]MDR6891949.1 phosphate transport system substrate-binding protein [Falsarthrobacter nasiphocae]
MKAIRFGRAAAVLSVAAVALTACGSDNPSGTSNGNTAPSGSNVSGQIKGIGASSQKAAMQEWMTQFQSANSSAKVDYSPDGSGAGRKAFIAGGAQFAGTDSSFKDEELASVKATCASGIIEVPTYISPIAMAFNVPGVKELKLDSATAAKILRGDITKWNDPAIAKLNSDAKLPDLAITPVHRSDDSGTTENFTDYLNKTAPDVWKDEKAQAWPSSLKGEAAKGTDGVISTVKSTEGAVTYADESAVGDLGVVAFKVGEEFVKPSAEAATKALDASKPKHEGSKTDLALKLDRTTTASGAYPAILASYQVFCSTYKDAKTADTVKAWAKYVVSEEGQKAAADAAGSAPISSELSKKATAAIDTIKAG